MIGRVYIMRSGDLVYIGSTTHKLNSRLAGHRSAANTDKGHSSQALFRTGLPVTIELLEEVEVCAPHDIKLREREQHHMKFYPDRVNTINALEDEFAQTRRNRKHYLANREAINQRTRNNRKADRFRRRKLLQRVFLAWKGTK